MPTVIALGDLVLCLRTNVPVESFACLPANEDIVFDTSIDISAGGTAISFCEVIRAYPGIEAIAVGCSGRDREGAVLRHEILERGFATDGLQDTDLGPTSVILTAYSRDRSRMMLQPAEHANHFLTAAPVMRLLARLSDVRLVWLSGYALVRRDVPRFNAIQEVCAWARDAGVPIVVDLVPHAFVDAVGDLEFLEMLIGKYQGVIATTKTATELGYGSPLNSENVFDEACLERLTIALSVRTGFASVEHRVNGYYHQAIAMSGRLIKRLVFSTKETMIADFGDRIAIDALMAAGLL